MNIKSLQEKVFATDLIFLSAITYVYRKNRVYKSDKKRGDFSLPPSPHGYTLNDSL